MEVLRVLISDNQYLTSVGISVILEQYFHEDIAIEYAKSKKELMAKLVRPPHVLIVDFDLFDFVSVKELSEIREIAPCMGVLVATDNHCSKDVLTVLDCGITNYIVKSCEEQELIDAFQATLTNKKYFSSSIIDLLLEQKRIKQKIQSIPAHITPAEKEIIRLIARGLTTKEIAYQKNLSSHTVITHRKNIFRKLSIGNASELIMYAMRNGMVDTTEYYI